MKPWHWLIIIAIVLLLAGGGTVAVVKYVATETEKKRLAGLLPQVRDALQRTRAALDAKGIRTLVGETRRDDALQAAHVADGVSATNNSWHKLGRAVDLYPYVDGKPDLDGKHVETFRTMQIEAGKNGFHNIAFNTDGSLKYIVTSKGKVWDGGHMQYTDGMTFAQAAAQQGVKVA